MNANVLRAKRPVVRYAWRIDQPPNSTSAPQSQEQQIVPSWPGGTGVHSVDLSVTFDDGHQARRRIVISHTLDNAWRPQTRLPDSVWTKLAPTELYPDSASQVDGILRSNDLDGVLSSDPSQYTYTVYVINPIPPGRTVANRALVNTGFYRNYVPESNPIAERPGEPDGPGGYGMAPRQRMVDVEGVGGPPAADEGQVIFWDKVNQEYWAYWRYQLGLGPGHAQYQNGYHYGTGPCFSDMRRIAWACGAPVHPNS